MCGYPGLPCRVVWGWAKSEKVTRTVARSTLACTRGAVHTRVVRVVFKGLDDYELRVVSQVPLYTTRSIWTFVTNQRRILDDNAPENSRTEAQLLVVKIRRGGRRTCNLKKGTPQSKINLSFFTNFRDAMEGRAA